MRFQATSAVGTNLNIYRVNLELLRDGTGRVEGTIELQGIRGALVDQGGELLMRAATVPLNVGLGYTTLPTRKTGYAIPYAPALDAVVQIAIAGAKFTSVPSTENIQNGLATYTRAVEVAPGGASLEVRTTASLKTGVFDPGVYPQLAGVTREVKAAEDQVIRAR